MPPYRPYRPSRGLWRIRLRRWLRSAVAILILLAAASYLWGDPVGGERITPTNDTAARAIDGDSFTMPQGSSQITVRIEGIDAPEYRQICLRADGSPWPCGAEAFAALSAHLLEGGLNCGVSAADRFHRRVASCRTVRTPDVGAAMVERGLAITNGRGDLPAYWLEQERAEGARRGLWQGAFERPVDWRRTHPR